VSRPIDAHLTPEEKDGLADSASAMPEDIRHHLESCPACAREVERHRAAGKFLSGLNTTRTPGGSDCPPPSVWWEIAAGILEDGRSELLLNHAAACDPCGRELAAALAASENYDGPLALDNPASRAALAAQMAGKSGAGKSKSFLPWLLPMAAALAIVSGGALYYTLHRSTDRLIAQAYAEKRTVEFRIAGAPHAPLRVERSSAAGGENRTAALLEAEARVVDQLRQSPDSPRLLEQKGRIDLLNWNYDSALREITRASELEPANLNALLDLSLAYFERAETENRSTDAGTAAELLSRVLQKQPNYPEALFDRAIVLERLHMYREAQADWEKYLRLDPQSSWSKEARERLDAIRSKLQAKQNGAGACASLSAETVAGWNGDVARQIEKWEGEFECLRERALAAWLRRAGESPYREALLVTAQAFQQATGDTWFPDLLRSSSAAGFDQASQALSEAVDANLTLESERALKSAENAMALFHALGNQAGYAQALRERIYASRRFLDSPECVAGIQTVLPEVDRHSWPWSSMQLHLELASCLAMPGDYRGASREIRAVLAATLNPAHASLHLRALSYLASYEGYSADDTGAWDDGERGLAAYWRGNFQHVWAYQLFYNLANTAAKQQRYHLAEQLQRETLAEIQASNRPLLEAFTWFDYGRTSALADDFTEAQQALTTASQLFAKLPRDRALVVAEAECEAYLAEIENRQGKPAQARARLDRVAGDMQHITVLPPWFRYARISAETDRMLGTTSDYENRLRLLVGLSELELESSGRFEQQQQWLTETGDVYEMLAGYFAIDRRDPQRALDFWEWSRSAPLWPPSLSKVDPVRFQSVTNAPPFPEVPSAAEMLAKAGVSQALVLLPLPDQLLAWQVKDGQVSARVVPVRRSELEKLARQLYVLCSSPDSDRALETSVAAQLSRYLVGPLEWPFSPDQPLWIELNGALNGVPLQVLPLPSGELVGDRYALAMFPGEGYLDSSAALAGVNANSAVLAVGISAAGSTPVRGLAPVPSAVEEATQVALRFPSHQLLTDRQATLSAIRRELPNAAIFHFAGHSWNTAGRVGLLVAPESGGEEDSQVATLDAREVVDMSLKGCRLAVISACSAEAPNLFAERQRFGFASALLRAGVSGVLTTRWDLDSNTALEFTKEFYSRLAQGASPVRAARLAAMEIRRRPGMNRSFYWAAYQFFGR
jgi:CHAT domain-containing protein